MFAFGRVVSSLFGSVSRTESQAFGSLQHRFYSSAKPKTNALKSKEKSKLRRQRISKTDKPAQAKRNVRVSKL
ncbi:hypothetical protein GGI07_004644 [Coemansia sp. Benny D115]|nr:hypothetical protein GGI07_004644 [Coemansia sp. Benny D115]